MALPPFGVELEADRAVRILLVDLVARQADAGKPFLASAAAST
jgi:hypothetical protein